MTTSGTTEGREVDGPPPLARRGAKLVLACLVGGLLLAGLVGLVLTDCEPENDLSGSQALLHGRVLSADSNAPVAGANVTVEHGGGQTRVQTDERGRFRAVVDTSRPIGVTADAPGHMGVVAFGKLCPRQRKDVRVVLPLARPGQAPPAPLVLTGGCR